MRGTCIVSELNENRKTLYHFKNKEDLKFFELNEYLYENFCLKWYIAKKIALVYVASNRPTKCSDYYI